MIQAKRDNAFRLCTVTFKRWRVNPLNSYRKFKSALVSVHEARIKYYTRKLNELPAENCRLNSAMLLYNIVLAKI